MRGSKTASISIPRHTHIRVPRLALLRGHHAHVDGMSRVRVGFVDGTSASRVSRRSHVRSRGAEIGSRVVGPS